MAVVQQERLRINSVPYGDKVSDYKGKATQFLPCTAAWKPLSRMLTSLFAKQHAELTFLVTRIGCGIAGFTDKEMAPLFIDAVDVANIHLPDSFWKELI